MTEQSLRKYPYRVKIHLAGIPISLSLEYEEAYRYFASFYPRTSKVTRGLDDYACTDISLSETDWEMLQKHGFKRCGQVEASFLTSYCSDSLLQFSRCVVHAAAFRDAKKAWIIAADPGVGKSTQIRTLQGLYAGSFSVICGDRTILELSDDDLVIAHPSPWNGKEFWGGAEAAPLAGIICLRRGEVDRITRLNIKQAVMPVYRSLIHSAINGDVICKAASFTEELLHRVPVWEFVNKDVPKSTRLLYQQILSEESE